jgi:hypothetical protein
MPIDVTHPNPRRKDGNFTQGRVSMGKKEPAPSKRTGEDGTVRGFIFHSTLFLVFTRARFLFDPMYTPILTQI